MEACLRLTHSPGALAPQFVCTVSSSLRTGAHSQPQRLRFHRSGGGLGVRSLERCSGASNSAAKFAHRWQEGKKHLPPAPSSITAGAREKRESLLPLGRDDGRTTFKHTFLSELAAAVKSDQGPRASRSPAWREAAGQPLGGPGPGSGTRSRRGPRVPGPPPANPWPRGGLPGAPAPGLAGTRPRGPAAPGCGRGPARAPGPACRASPCPPDPTPARGPGPPAAPAPRPAPTAGGRPWRRRGCTHLHGRHSLGHFPAQRRLLVADLLRGQGLRPAPAPAVQPQALDAQLLRLRPC